MDDSDDEEARGRFCEYHAASKDPVDDLVMLPGPLTEHVVLQTLQSHFFNGKFQTRVGSVLVSLNPFGSPPPNRALQTGMKDMFTSLVRNVRNILLDTSVSQVVILNGVSGSGKTHNSHVLLRTLFGDAGGGCQTDSFKYLSAALTVIQAFGSAATANNPDSSRLGYFFENVISEGAIYRTKIHCYLSDPYRVCRSRGRDRNFNIFYQMLFSLTPEERAKYHMTGYHTKNLAYLSACEAGTIDENIRTRFATWKACLGVLGVPLSDILRILSAILLLGNVTFVHGDGLDLVVQGEKELALVGSLLGISVTSLYKGFTQRTKRMGGHVFKACCDQDSANYTKDNLVTALYCRTLLALVKRANSTRSLKMASTASTSSGESFISETNVKNLLSAKSSTQGSRTSINHVLAPKSSEFIGVLDMFGFENIGDNGLGQLCINLCAEALQHLYNTHVFKATEEACIEEGVQCDMDVYYSENAPLVELISSQRTGILSILEDEGRMQAPATDAFIHKIRVTHKKTDFFEESSVGTNFTIKHFAGKVEYNAKDFLASNRECLHDDLLSIFTKGSCNFGFVSHLFSAEIKHLQENNSLCRGETFPVMPRVISSDYVYFSDNHPKTFSGDFHARLDGLLKILVQARPHFVRCIRSNVECKKNVFDTSCVCRQLRSLQVLETLHITATGFPHRLRYRTFNNRYKLIIPKVNNNNILKHDEMKPFAISKVILDVFLQMKEHALPFASAHWALGKKHIFLSEIGHQQLEAVRDEIRRIAATKIQTKWRTYVHMSRWPILKTQLLKRLPSRRLIIINYYYNSV
ncbi:hypothetical protein CAPTEDRAFT_96159 [Capitella teleta]|uniref:Myosin motor domain-containing protein n=1 Tax=Capitella teleta TaxID=283909 RepID=R7UM04_CAPTE|nr:hypothetical protein CAPTEDRAFT_96159 [Capitella teleta]|eukprot:ELU07103.1 hypothetical protein CAPTEDRAFT_96159 [Capitella teleta]